MSNFQKSPKHEKHEKDGFFSLTLGRKKKAKEGVFVINMFIFHLRIWYVMEVLNL